MFTNSLSPPPLTDTFPIPIATDLCKEQRETNENKNKAIGRTILRQSETGIQEKNEKKKKEEKHCIKSHKTLNNIKIRNAFFCGCKTLYFVKPPFCVFLPAKNLGKTLPFFFWRHTISTLEWCSFCLFWGYFFKIYVSFYGNIFIFNLFFFALYFQSIFWNTLNLLNSVNIFIYLFTFYIFTFRRLYWHRTIAYWSKAYLFLPLIDFIRFFHDYLIILTHSISSHMRTQL